jgi:hypothetical protein
MCVFFLFTPPSPQLGLKSWYSQHVGLSQLYAKLGISIEETNTSIGIPASMISIWYWNKKMPDCISLVRYRTGSATVSFFSFWYRTDWILDRPAFRHFEI